MPSTEDPPDGIEVDFFDLSSGGSRVAQSYDAGGQCVKFAADTRYKIEIINWNTRKVATDVHIDGRKVNLTPVLIRAARGDKPGRRAISGFQLLRTFEERNEIKGGLLQSRYAVRTTEEPFIARRPSNVPNAQRAQRVQINPALGTIEFAFYAVTYVPCCKEHRSGERVAPPHTPQGHARSDVLITQGAGRVLRDGQHTGQQRRPVADCNRRLGDYTVTIRK